MAWPECLHVRCSLALWRSKLTMYRGYYGDAKATEEALTPDGWLRSGDIGRVNRHGLFWVTDRIKNMIKVRGFQVAPAELESILISHPLVHDAGVKRGLTSDGAELPVAFVVVDEAHRSEEAARDIEAFVASKVSYYKRLARVVFLDALPRKCILNPACSFVKLTASTVRAARFFIASCQRSSSLPNRKRNCNTCIVNHSFAAPSLFNFPKNTSNSFATCFGASCINK